MTLRLADERRDAEQRIEKAMGHVVVRDHHLRRERLDVHVAFHQPQAMPRAIVAQPVEHEQPEVERRALVLERVVDVVDQLLWRVADAEVQATPEIEVDLEDASALVTRPAPWRIGTTWH